MKPIARIGTALCLLLAASCGDGSDTINEVREGDDAEICSPILK